MNTRLTPIAIRSLLFFLTLVGGLMACQAIENRQREPILSDQVPEVEQTREVKILTVFFGLDNALPPRARAMYKNAAGQDGMPIVFSHEVDPETLDGTDFEVTTQDGTKHVVEFATLLPAEEEFELRTALLIGEYGNYPDNPPVSLEVIDDLITRTGVNYKGKTQSVIDLPSGPIFSYAEYFTLDDDYPYLAEGNGCDCPKEGTTQVVKAVWSGGVRALNGEELGEAEREDFTVTLVQGTDTLQVVPYMLADLGDGDNNTDLCLKEAGTPIYVQANANIAIDPRDDPNPATGIAVVSRW